MELTRAALKDPGCPPWQSYLVFQHGERRLVTYSKAQSSCSGQDSPGLVPAMRCTESHRVPSFGGPPGVGDNVCAPSCPLQDVMVVGEPTLMGGEFGDEDERLITRLENTQFDAANGIDDEDSFNSSPTMGTNSPWNSKAPSSQQGKNDNPSSQSSQ